MVHSWTSLLWMCFRLFSGSDFTHCDRSCALIGSKHCFNSDLLQNLQVQGVSIFWQLYFFAHECACMRYVRPLILSIRLLKGKPLPNPSKYFQTVHSVHEGNLKVRIIVVNLTQLLYEAHIILDMGSVSPPCEFFAVNESNISVLDASHMSQTHKWAPVVRSLGAKMECEDNCIIQLIYEPHAWMLVESLAHVQMCCRFYTTVINLPCTITLHFMIYVFFYESRWICRMCVYLYFSADSAGLSVWNL